MSKILSKIGKKKKELLERKIGGKKKQNRLSPMHVFFGYYTDFARCVTITIRYISFCRLSCALIVLFPTPGHPNTPGENLTLKTNTCPHA